MFDFIRLFDWLIKQTFSTNTIPAHKHQQWGLFGNWRNKTLVFQALKKFGLGSDLHSPIFLQRKRKMRETLWRSSMGTRSNTASQINHKKLGKIFNTESLKSQAAKKFNLKRKKGGGYQLSMTEIIPDSDNIGLHTNMAHPFWRTPCRGLTVFLLHKQVYWT